MKKTEILLNKPVYYTSFIIHWLKPHKNNYIILIYKNHYIQKIYFFQVRFKFIKAECSLQDFANFS